MIQPVHVILFFCFFSVGVESRLIPHTTLKTFKSMARIADFAFIPIDENAVSDGADVSVWPRNTVALAML